MKELSEIINQESRWLGLFEDEKSLCKEFEIDPSVLDGKKILFAYYEYENYSGDAFVLGYDYSTDSLFEVNGGHCSCMGLEHQWEPEETNLEHLAIRIKKDKEYYPQFKLLKEFLGCESE